MPPAHPLRGVPTPQGRGFRGHCDPQLAQDEVPIDWETKEEDSIYSIYTTIRPFAPLGNHVLPHQVRVVMTGAVRSVSSCSAPEGWGAHSGSLCPCTVCPPELAGGPGAEGGTPHPRAHLGAGRGVTYNGRPSTSFHMMPVNSSLINRITN